MKLGSILNAVSVEDLIQEAELAAYLAFINKGDTTKGTESITAYLGKRGRGAMIDALRRMTPGGRFFQIPRSAFVSAELIDVKDENSPDLDFEVKERYARIVAKAICRHVGKLTHLEVLNLVLEGKSISAIAATAGVCVARVSRVVDTYS